MSSRKVPRDPHGRHVRIYCTLLDSPAWRVLGYAAQALFLRLRGTLTGSNNGNISATLSVLKHYGWNSSETLANALKELQALGFIAQTRGGGVALGSRICSLYRFTDIDCFEVEKQGIPFIKADHLYLKFDSVTAAAAALRDAKGKKTTLRKSKHTASKIEAQDDFTASKIEVEGAPLLRFSKQTEKTTDQVETQSAQGMHGCEERVPAETASASKIEHLYKLPGVGGGECGLRGVR